MTDYSGYGRPTDADLVAYIDGELDVAEQAAIDARLGTDETLRARAGEPRCGERDFGPAFI